MRELPRQLSVAELTPLFSGRTPLVDELAARPDPLAVAEDVALALPKADQVAALATHPRIGEPSEEQRGAEPEVLAELARLNDEYERRFGFEFVVFVDGRTRAELLPILRERLENTREEELETGLRALCDIARDRMDTDYLRDLADLCLRMLHVVAGIAWIGASFYFIRLDLGLAPPKEPKEGVAGEYWGVHGGGFYHSQKYKVAPPRLPEQLHWFKWEAYTTWLSGFALLVVLYWLDADTRLVDPTVADLSAWQAVALSAAGLALAWLIYDLACRLLIEDRLVAIAVIALVAVSAFAAGELFAARASYLQVGAMLGTIMAANVFFVIIPAHRELVRAKQEGREPNPLLGLRAKQRSVHNNYLTLPVVFTMLAGHFPLAFGSDHAWLVLLAIFAIVAAIRHFFNRWHAGKRDWWILAAAGRGGGRACGRARAGRADAISRAERRAEGGRDHHPALRRLPLRNHRPARHPAREHRAAAGARGRDRRRWSSRARCRPGT